LHFFSVQHLRIGQIVMAIKGRDGASKRPKGRKLGTCYILNNDQRGDMEQSRRGKNGKMVWSGDCAGFLREESFTQRKRAGINKVKVFTSKKK